LIEKILILILPTPMIMIHSCHDIIIISIYKWSVEHHHSVPISHITITVSIGHIYINI